jgi:L-threonylcarbamoyladenylate synthase
VESTVLDLSAEYIRLLRPGGTPREAIEKLIGPVHTGPFTVGNKAEIQRGLVSPGQLKSHYAPHTPLSAYSLETILGLPAQTGSAFLFFDGPSSDAWLAAHRDSQAEKAVIRVLSETGSLLEAAAHLFEILHELDSWQGRGITRIAAQFAPEQGLGVAINDRLQRAAGRVSPRIASRPKIKP